MRANARCPMPSVCRSRAAVQSARHLLVSSRAGSRLAAPSGGESRRLASPLVASETYAIIGPGRRRVLYYGVHDLDVIAVSRRSARRSSRGVGRAQASRGTVDELTAPSSPLERRPGVRPNSAALPAPTTAAAARRPRHRPEAWSDRRRHGRDTDGWSARPGSMAVLVRGLWVPASPWFEIRHSRRHRGDGSCHPACRWDEASVSRGHGAIGRDRGGRNLRQSWTATGYARHGDGDAGRQRVMTAAGATERDARDYSTLARRAPIGWAWRMRRWGAPRRTARASRGVTSRRPAASSPILIVADTSPRMR